MWEEIRKSSGWDPSLLFFGVYGNAETGLFDKKAITLEEAKQLMIMQLDHGLVNGCSDSAMADFSNTQMGAEMKSKMVCQQVMCCWNSIDYLCL